MHFASKEIRMAAKTDWEAMAANLLKAELKRKGVTYAQLVEKLGAIGVDEKEVNVRNKLSRGSFTAAYLLQCLSAIGSQSLRLE
jgi:3-mercaptopyruvate sulfurtransferase SseA